MGSLIWKATISHSSGDLDMDIEQYILEHFHYHDDGTISRDDRKNSTGSYDKDGYLILKVKTKQFKAHRIVWLLNYGKFPETELDHINRIRSDNRIENLRESNREQQSENRDIEPNKDTGEIGIYIDKTDGLKKRYAFKFKKKTYRFYTLKEAKEYKEWLKTQ